MAEDLVKDNANISEAGTRKSEARRAKHAPYNPREYWAARLKKNGPKYVAVNNKKSEFTNQERVFWDHISANIPPGGDVLDFGCGVGRFAARFAELCDSYTGVDINEKALEYAPVIENSRYVYLEDDKLPFDDNSFDVAVALTVLQHIVAPEQYDNWTSELARVVKTGGCFFIVDAPQYENGALIKNAGHMCRRTPEIISASLKSVVAAEDKLSAESKDSHYYFLATKTAV